MKMGLENILHQTKIFLATSLTALALYAPAQDITKLNTKQDGSWEGNLPVTLTLKNMTNSQNRDLGKNKLNLFETQVYISGRKTSEGDVEFSYMTTDLEKPSVNAAVLDNVKTKIYYYGDSDTTAEIISQKMAIMSIEGEITFEEATPKEKASSLLIKLGDKILERADTFTKEYVESKTAGILSIGIKEAAINYCENQTVSIGRKAKEKTGYELAINAIPMELRDKNLAIMRKEVGRITKLRFSSKSAKEIPVAIFYHLALQRNGRGNTYAIGSENEFGTLEAYTDAFATSARIIQSETCAGGTVRSTNPFEGFWYDEKIKKTAINAKSKIIKIISGQAISSPAPFFPRQNLIKNQVET